jgi:hypothetical protein
MTTYADLEIGLHRSEVDTYGVDFRFSQPDSEADVRPGHGIAQIDIKSLQKLSPGSAEYGKSLTDSLFGDPLVLSAFTAALASAQTSGSVLRIRLLIGPSAPELHALYWETLLHPQTGASLCTDENILFSRYLSSLDWRPVHLRPKGDLSALIAVANPSNLSDYQNLAAIDVDGETQRAQESLGPIKIATLPEKTAEGKEPFRTTLKNLIDKVREASPDILYLVCHGALSRDEPMLWLEDDEGKAAVTPGTELVTRLRELTERPLLVVLASCQSAGHPTYGEALAALGPRLAEGGIPAVIAMQANISLKTIAELMPVFFSELQKDGQIDQALAVARGAVRDHADYWMPALFMRLKSGRVWYTPGFGEGRGAFEKWPSIVRTISRGLCTPILGPGLYESMLGSPREIARRWAETYDYPMAPYERESLPQVAQFLAVNQYAQAPYDELEDSLKKDIRTRFTADLPPELSANGASLDQMIDAVGVIRRKLSPIEPYRVLAELPLPVYITTNWNNLLASALKEVGKEPTIVLCPWNDYIEQLQADFDQNFKPTVDHPLVYYLFGKLSEPESVVLTEDDYFDYLIGVTRNKELIPSVVRSALVNSALLFLGFQLDDWQFRVLFRSIRAQQGGELLGRYPHIGVQLEPEEGRILEPERARKYLEGYFSTGANISLYWGRAEDFLKELHERWQARPA